VLVSGGENSDGSSVKSAELYDPSTGMWTNTSTMHYERVSHTATVLANGNILVIGGNLFDYNTAITPELYHSSTDTYIPTKKMNNAQSFHKDFLSRNGKVLATGKNNRSTFNNAQAH
jgi:hypothetical protein